jgi:hypothetical protein
MIVGPPPSGALVRSVPAPTMAAGYTTGAAAGNGAEATPVPALILRSDAQHRVSKDGPARNCSRAS